MLHLRTFGCLTLSDDAGSDWLARASQPKRSALFVYLATARPYGPVERDRLLALFWPEASSQSGRSSLNQALHYIRQHTDPGVLVSVGNGRILLDEGRCEVDVRRFSAAVAAEAFEEAVQLHSGLFLDGFHVSHAPLFSDWLEEERSYLARMAVGAAQAAADSCITRGSESDAANLARKALEWAPYDDEVLCWTLRMLDRCGDPTGAVRLFNEAEDRILRELDLPPSAHAEAIIKEIRERERALPPLVRRPPSEGHGPDREEEATSAPPGHSSIHEEHRGHEGDGLEVPGRIGTGPLASALRLLATVAAVALGVLWVTSLGRSSDLDYGRVLLATSDGVPEWLAEGLEGRLAGEGHLDVAVAEGPDRPGENVSLETAVVVSARRTGAGSAVLLSGETGGLRVQVFHAGTGSVRASMVKTGGGSEIVDQVAGVVVLFADTTFSHWSAAPSVAPGLNSLLAYKEGFELQRALDIEGARDAWRRALESQPDFYLAALELLGVESVPRRDSLAGLLESRYEDLSTVERLHFEAWTARGPARRPARLARLQEAASLLPERYGAWGARVALDLGDWEEAHRLGNLVAPEHSLADNPYFPLVAALHSLGRHEAELAVARRATLMHPEQRINQNFEIAALAALGRIEDIEGVLVDRTQWSSPDALDLGFGIRNLAASELWMHGFKAEASTVARNGIELLESQGGDIQESSSYTLADLYRWAGDFESALDWYRFTLDAYPTWFGAARDAGVAAGLAGDEEAAEYWFKRLTDWQLPSGQESYRTFAMARVRAAQNRPAAAARLVRLSLAQGHSHVGFRTAPELVPYREHPAFQSVFSAPVF